jgi:hypothetical protein
MSSSSPKGDDRVETSDMMMLSPSLCFSIIFRGDWTLDFMILSGNPRARDGILNALDQILQTYQEQKKKVSNDVLLLRYIWEDADKVSIMMYIYIIYISVEWWWYTGTIVLYLSIGQRQRRSISHPFFYFVFVSCYRTSPILSIRTN